MTMSEAEKQIALSIPNEPSRIPEARHFVHSFLMDVETSNRDVFEILLAVEEAATNALRHSHRLPGEGTIRVICEYAPARFTVRVSDDGPGFDYDPAHYREMPDPLAAGGRGLFLMHRLMDEVDVRSTPEGTAVTMTRQLHGLDDVRADSGHDRTYEGEGSFSSVHERNEEGARQRRGRPRLFDDPLR